MSYQFPKDDYFLRFPKVNYPTTMPIEHEPLIDVKSRKTCKIYLDDGLANVLAGSMSIPDDGSPISENTIRYYEKTLDIDKIKCLIPEPYHSLIDSVLGSISPKRYTEHISEITIVYSYDDQAGQAKD